MTASEDTPFYVCFYLEDGRPVAHVTAAENEFPVDLASLDTGKPGEPEGEPSHSEFPDHFKRYVDAMLGYVDFLPLTIGMGQLLSQGLMQGGLESFLRTNSTRVEELGNRRVFEVPSRFYSEFRMFEQTFSAAQATGRDIPRMLTVGLISTYEYHLSQWMRGIVQSRPEAIFGKAQAIPIQEVLTASTVEALKQKIIDNEIDDVMRKSPDEQISWIENKIRLDSIATGYGQWPQLMELFARRNLFAHTSGIVNEQYIKSGQKHGFIEKTQPALGDQLDAGYGYFRNALRLTIDFGVKLIQVIWRKMHPEETEKADELLSGLGFELLVRGRYRQAVEILEFGVNLRGHSSERLRRMLVVNYANALKLNGNNEQCQTVLNNEDWSASGDDFRICVAAIKEETDAVVQMMRKMGQEGEIEQEAYQEWPAFFHVRDSEAFRAAFKEIFDLDYVPAPRERGSFRALLGQLKIQIERVESEQAGSQPLETLH